MNSWQNAGRFFFGTPLRAVVTLAVALLLWFTGILPAFVSGLAQGIITLLILIAVLVAAYRIALGGRGGGGRH